MLKRFVISAIAIVAFALFQATDVASADQTATAYGPAKGTLVIAGGGSLVGTGVLEKFIELAGGRDKKFIIVPTARGNRNIDGSVRVYEPMQNVGPWLNIGLKHVTMLHTHDPKIADTEEFNKNLKDADAVWFDGGRQWNLVDSYANTRTLEEFRKLLNRGGVIGGSSAGATIQGEYLVRGDTSGPEVMMTMESNHQDGFKFLRRTAIDQHIDTRNRWDDLIPVVQKFPNMLGIGLSENTAIIVRGDTFEVIGKGQVAVHDNTRTYGVEEKPYFLLSPGEVYDMKAREIEK